VSEAGAPVRVLYLMGVERSGTTILGEVLGQAEGVSHLGEVRNIWRAGLVRGGPCGCGRPVPECELWSAATAEALPEGADPAAIVGWLRRTLRLRHLRRFLAATRGGSLGLPQADAYASLAARLYPALAAASGSEVVVDSSKHPVSAAVLCTVPGLDVRLVHVLRDPRATAYSWTRGKAAPGRPRDRMWRAPAWRAARAWVLANLAADRVRARYPGRSMFLRYEDAMADPRRAVAAMLRHAGLPDARVPIEEDGAVVLGPQHSGSGNPVRLTGGRVQLREDDAWRTAQRRRDRLVVMALTGPFLRRYGYPRPSRPGGAA
jgi:Sulfotransferase family